MRRWAVVVLLLVAVVTPGLVVRHWPASGSDLSAVALRERIGASAGRGWSGEVLTQGRVELPLTTSDFGGVARLLGERSELRVFWRDPTHWRVDRLRVGGESGLYRAADAVTEWSFESNRATLAGYSPVRLPFEADALPTTLAARLLSGARAGELSRLPAQRVAGISSPGLRRRVADTRSTLDHIDVWADAGTGLPTKVEVFSRAERTGTPVLTSQVTSLDRAVPSPGDVAFTPGDGIRVRVTRNLDQAAESNVYAPFEVPGSLLDLARQEVLGSVGAVGVYGRGPSTVLVVPLRRTRARDLESQLAKSASALRDDGGITLAVGPVTVRLTTRYRGSFLLLATLDAPTLRRAGDELVRRVVFLG